MIKRILFLPFCLFTIIPLYAQQTIVREFNHAGPYAVTRPLAFDTVDVQGKKFDDKSLLDAVSLTSPVTGKFSGEVLPSLADSHSVGVLSFFVNNADYLKGKILIKGPKNYKLYIDGAEASGEELKLAPEHHTIALKYLAEPKDTDSIHVTIEADKAVAYTLDNRHPYMSHDLFDGKRVRNVRLSADGRYVVVSYQTVERGGDSHYDYELCYEQHLSVPHGTTREYQSTFCLQPALYHQQKSCCAVSHHQRFLTTDRQSCDEQQDSSTQECHHVHASHEQTVPDYNRRLTPDLCDGQPWAFRHYAQTE